MSSAVEGACEGGDGAGVEEGKRPPKPGTSKSKGMSEEEVSYRATMAALAKGRRPAAKAQPQQEPEQVDDKNKDKKSTGLERPARWRNERRKSPETEAPAEPINLFVVDKDGMPDRDWKPNRGEEGAVAVKKGGDSAFDGLDGKQSEREWVVNRRYEYTRSSHRRRNGTSGNFSSFIPPMPREPLFLTDLWEEPTTVPEISEEEAQRRVRENIKIKSQYLEEPKPVLPIGAFYCTFYMITHDSHVLLKFNDFFTEGSMRDLRGRIRTYFFNESIRQNLQMRLEEIEVDRIVMAEWSPGEYVRATIVKVNSLDEDPTVQIRECDEGWEMKTVPAEHIFFMPPMLLDTPFGMQKCKIDGLELWHGTRVLYEVNGLIKSLDRIMRVVDHRLDKDERFAVMTLEVKATPPAPNSSEQDIVTLNNLLKHIVGGFTRIPRLFVKGMILEKAHISIAEGDGEVWIQMHSAVASKLCCLGGKAKATYSPKLKDPAKEFERLHFDEGVTRFLSTFNEDLSYYRIDVLEANKGEESVKVRYVDFGNTEVVKSKDILPVEAIDPILGIIPAQAFKAYLNGIEKLLDPDEIFENVSVQVLQRFKVAGFKEPNVPLLDVYGQLDPDIPNEWPCVNNFIIEKGFASGPGVSNPLPSLTPERTATWNKSPAEKGYQEQKRYLTSCRVVTPRDGVLSHYIKNQE